ncbi:TetR-like C-terminal domain-containing protein [Nocardia vulneris]|uniref:HTH-type transcriptional regulator MT1864/Rv1816-like C-terminal domain-containing protein n=1 Tax=Nocardia vulneris TaxID=1141657 RepID=A0ABR4Z6G4_9NOCA|nr:TetR-like C-terminal domain-containing protein [Nocardia vulneris]KIA60922.1 hypothetical protein FG87_34235 [Nocardia vulneris]
MPARAYLDFALANPALLTLMFARKRSPTGGAEMGAAVAAAFAVPVTLTADAQPAASSSRAIRCGSAGPSRSPCRAWPVSSYPGWWELRMSMRYWTRP